MLWKKSDPVEVPPSSTPTAIEEIEEPFVEPLPPSLPPPPPLPDSVRRFIQRGAELCDPRLADPSLNGGFASPLVIAPGNNSNAPPQYTDNSAVRLTPANSAALKVLDGLPRFNFGEPARAFLRRSFDGHASLGAIVVPPSIEVLTKRLEFYPGYSLLYLTNYGDLRRPGLVLLKEDDLDTAVFINADKLRIHALNDRLPLQLSAESVRDYVVFYFASVGNYPRFFVVESADDLNWMSTATAGQRLAVISVVEPIAVRGLDPAGRHHLEMFVLFVDTLFKTDAYVDSSGRIELANPVEVLSNLAVRPESMLPISITPPPAPAATPHKDPTVVDACSAQCERDEVRCSRINRDQNRSCMRNVIGLYATDQLQACRERNRAAAQECRRTLRSCLADCGSYISR